jgi:hypothetical protein
MYKKVNQEYKVPYKIIIRISQAQKWRDIQSNRDSDSINRNKAAILKTKAKRKTGIVRYYHAGSMFDRSNELMVKKKRLNARRTIRGNPD